MAHGMRWGGAVGDDLWTLGAVERFALRYGLPMLAIDELASHP